MIQSLKPCPYCGATPFEGIRTKAKENWFHRIMVYCTVFIGCKECKIEMNSDEILMDYISFDRLNRLQDSVRKRWNKRTDTFLTIINSDSRL